MVNSAVLGGSLRVQALGVTEGHSKPVFEAWLEVQKTNGPPRKDLLNMGGSLLV